MSSLPATVLTGFHPRIFFATSSVYLSIIVRYRSLSETHLEAEPHSVLFSIGMSIVIDTVNEVYPKEVENVVYARDRKSVV